MNEKEFNKGIKDIKNIRLKNGEKNLILKSILSAPMLSPYAPKRSLWQFFVEQKSLSHVWAFLFVLVTVSAVTAYSAESSLPGDKLYSLKVEVSEPVRDFLSITPQTKAQWEGVKAARRLDEAADLSIKGQLNEEVRNDLEERFNKHANAFDSLVTNMISSSTPESDLIELEFEANISARAKVLNDLSNDEDEKENISAEAAPREAASSLSTSFAASSTVAASTSASSTIMSSTTASSTAKDKIQKNKEENRKQLKKLENAVSEKLKNRKNVDKNEKIEDFIEN